VLSEPTARKRPRYWNWTDGHWLLGSMPAMRADPLGMLVAAARAGEVVRMRFLHLHLLFFTEPDDIRYILVDNAKNFTKETVLYVRARSLLGNGLFTANGAAWRDQRRLMQPAFHKQRIAAFATTMARAAVEMADAWRAHAESGRPFDVSAEMTRVTMQIVSRTLFGGEVAGKVERVADAVSVASEMLTERMRRVFDLPLWLPTADNRRYANAIRTLDGVVYEIIARRRRDAKAHDDLLAMLLEARDEVTGRGMSDAQLRDEVMTIFLAGHETTATALTWVWALVAGAPAVEEKLHAELRRVLPDREPGLAEFEQLTYTRMVIEDVMLSPYVTHRLPSVWERPDAFDPERFHPDRAASLPRFGDFPFLGGPRQCIGNGVAMMEAVLILATLARRYRLALAPGHAPEVEPHLTLRPRGGMPMVAARV
jgi:cytochrome P450